MNIEQRYREAPADLSQKYLAQERYGRHLEFLGAENQARLFVARIGVAGCGAGSRVAEYFAQYGLGIQDLGGQIILTDPDSVAEGNLNRQLFDAGDIGENKAVALAKQITRRNPNIRPLTLAEGITLNNVADFVSQSDIIVEMVDVGALPYVIMVHDEAIKQGKSVVSGMDVGKQAHLFVFDYEHSGMGLREFLGISHCVEIEESAQVNSLAVTAQYLLGPVNYQFENTAKAIAYYKDLLTKEEIINQLVAVLPREMHSVLVKLLSGQLDYYPQDPLAADVLGIMQGKAVNSLILGERIATVPRQTIVNLDTMKITQL